MWTAFDTLTNVLTIIVGSGILMGITALAASLMNDFEATYLKNEEEEMPL